MNKEQLIESLRREGFSEKILKAFEKVKREDFIARELREHAYDDAPLPIGYGQTISQPYTIAFMLQLLEIEELDKENLKILEVGSGSGYVLALINEMCNKCEIYGIERIKELADKSKKILSEKNIKIICRDGSKGIEEFNKKFDRIIVSASAGEIPKKILTKLADNGILVCPVRESIFQIRKLDGKIKKKEFYGFVFVPLVEDGS